jgi:glutaredoxin 3
VKAKNLLNKWDIDYSEVAIDTGDSGLKEFRDATQGARTVPQILIDGKLIGGFSELTELHMDGDLDELIKQDCET